MTAPLDRATLFIDGSNWYHSVREIGVPIPGDLSYAKLSQKLIGPGRAWIGTRYYVGRVNQNEAPLLYGHQRQFLARLAATDPKISFHLGRLETHMVENLAARELKQMLATLPVRIDHVVFQQLIDLARRHVRVPVTHEKAVDVQIAVDMLIMAQRNEYDAAYLLTADGDFTPAVDAVRQLGKKVFAASPKKGGQLAAAVNSFIPLPAAWFTDCYL